MESKEVQIELETTDEKVFNVSINLAKKYFLSLSDHFERPTTPFKLPIHSKDFEIIRDYINHHGESESILPVVVVNKDTDLKKILSEFDYDLISKCISEDPILTSLSKSLDYLHMDNLIRKVGLYIATMVYNKSEGFRNRIAKEFAQLIKEN